MAILGELALTKGDRQIQGTIAYVPQEPWVLSDTVRSNIIMDFDFDQVVYDSVLKACTLDVVSRAVINKFTFLNVLHKDVLKYYQYLLLHSTFPFDKIGHQRFSFG